MKLLAGAVDRNADDSEYAGPFIAIPGKRDLDLGKPLVLAFARECLPDAFDEIAYIFGGRGAYRNFKALLKRKRALDRWYEFEAEAKKRALREWCELKKIKIEG